MKKSILIVPVLFTATLFATDCNSSNMKYLLSALNENLPKRVDEVTVITKVSCSKGSLIYNYVLNDTDELKMTEFDASQMDTFKKTQFKILKNNYCSDRMNTLRKFTDSIIWNYTTKDGKDYAKFEFKNNDCY